MKETPFAIVLISLFVFMGVLSGLVLLEQNQTSITEGTKPILNQSQSDTNHTGKNLTIKNGTGNQTRLNQTNQNLTDNYTNRTTNNNLTVKTIFGLETPMRDGVKLVSDIWLPQKKGKYPVIIIRTPYGRSAANMNYTGMGEYFAGQGYVFMVQDVRGKGDSQGNFNFLFQEGPDSFDTVEWAAKQPWSNGKIGMMGSSYMGTVQLLAAREKPPHLICIAPTSAYGRYMQEIPSIGGIFHMGWAIPWTLQNNGRNPDLNTQNINLTAAFDHRPLISVDKEMGIDLPFYRQFLNHPTMDEYWKQIQFTDNDFNQINIPTLTTSGLFDSNQPGALFYWNGNNKNPSRSHDHHLIIGPWTNNGTSHPSLQLSQVGDLPVPGGQVDIYGYHLAFFDFYLKNSTTNKSKVPAANIYLTGLNQWINLTNYPPKDLNVTPLYLTSSGQANTLNGNGILEWEFPQNNSSNLNDLNSSVLDKYTYDPANPRPVSVGSFAVDCAQTENRSDVLVYTTPPLEESVTILGPVIAEIFASTDSKDTDFIIRVLDVYPDGTSINLGPEECGGAIRARFRQGFDKEVLLEPGKIEKYRIELFDMGHVFLPGHRIRLEIYSSAYPLLHPNPNTGNPIATDTKQKKAHQTIYHDKKHPSAVYLPVISKNSSTYNQIFV